MDGVAQLVLAAVVVRRRRMLEEIDEDRTLPSYRDAARIIVVGYRFPAEDQYGCFLVREGLRLRSSGDPHVLFYELPAKAAERAMETVEVFSGHVHDVVYCGSVVAPTVP